MAKDPMYSDYLQFNPTFRWGGRSWGEQDRAAFEKYLRRRGINPQRWYRNHRVAQKVFDPTEQRIYGMFQPQLTAIDAERKRTADLWNRRMTNLTGFAQALMPYLQGIPGAIMTPYREGAAGVQSAGEGFGSSLNADDAATAAGANAVLQGIAAPEGQMLSGGDAGAVLAGIGGMEGDLMRAAGGAYSTAAKFLPQTASLEQLQAMRDLLSGAAEADKGFQSDILGVLQGLPAARAEIRDQAVAQASAKRKEALAQAKFEADQHYKNAMLALYQGDRKRYAAELKLAQQKYRTAVLSDQGLDAYGNPKPGYHLEGGTVVKDGWHLNPNTGMPVKDKSPGSKGEGKNPGAADVKTVGQYQDDIDRYIKNMGHEANPAEAARLGVDPFSVVYPKWEVAYKRLFNRFKNVVSTKKGKQALDQAIRAALEAAGITPGKTK